MLRFHILNGSGNAANLAGRFRRLVQAALPDLHRFRLSRLSRPPFSLADWFCDASLLGPTFETTTPPGWKRALRDTLWSHIRPQAQGTLQLALTDGSQRTVIGMFDPQEGAATRRLAPNLRRAIEGSIPERERIGRLDVRDLERLTVRARASLLVHEIIEQNSKQFGGLTRYEDAHRLAMTGETAVMGGRRLQAEEHTSSHIAGTATRWQWWIPYESPRRDIRAIIMYMLGGNVERSRLAGFPNLAAYHAAWSRMRGSD